MMFGILIFASIALFNVGYCTPTVIPTESVDLTNHFKDIIAIIPKDLIKNITYEHLRTDEEFKAAVKFMQSDEWINRVNIIREKPEWKALKVYIKEFGLDVDMFIKCVKGLIENVTVTLAPDHPPSKKSVKAFLIDLEQSLPTMKILTAVNEKMIQDNTFQHVFQKISSTETRKMVEDVLAIPEIKSLMKDLKDMDLNIADAISLIYLFLGWGENHFTLI